MHKLKILNVFQKNNKRLIGQKNQTFKINQLTKIAMLSK
jgi:hypothetical protein